MKIYSITQARQNMSSIAESSIENDEPVMITCKKERLILMPANHYSGMQETIYIQSIKGLKESILEAEKEPLSSCATSIDWGKI